MNATVSVTINGDRHEIPEGLSVASLLDHLGIIGGRVAIERNRDILARSAWDSTQVQANDSFEIVHLVGGG